MSASVKDIYKEILNSKSRFLTIMLIVFLGALTYVGMNTTVDVMNNTADTISKKYNLYDIRVDNAFGFTDEDKKILSSYDEIKSITFYTEELNSDTKTLLINSDKISGNDALSLVNTKTQKLLPNYKVIGTDFDISYLQNEITKSGIKIKRAFLVNNLSANNNVALIRLKDSYKYMTFDKGYIEYIEKSKNEIKTLLHNRPSDRKVEIQNEINDGLQTISENLDKIVTSIMDLKTKKEELIKELEKLNNRKKEFDNAPKVFLENKTKINENLKLISDKKLELESNLALINTGLDEINKNYTKVLSGLEKIREEEKNLDEKAKKVNDLKPGIFLPQSKIDEYKEKIKEGYIKLKSEKEKLEDVINKKKELEENKIKVENGLKELRENEDFLLKNSEKLKLEEENYYRTYNDNQKKFKNAYKQIEDAKKKIEDGSTKLIDARTELNTKKLDLENKIEFLVAPIYSVGSRFDNFSFSVLYNNTQSMKIMSIIFPLCFFIIVLFVVTTTMIRFTYEQRKSIGLYRFLGYGKAKIYAKFLIYALIPTIIGIILGSLVGTYLLPKIIYPPFVTDFIPIFKELNIVFIPKYTIIIFLIFVLTITFTIIIVVSKEIKENIVSLLIGKETNIAKRILIEKSRLWQKLKFSAKILLRNIFKYKGRLIMTIIGIGGCTALIYLGISLDDSIKNITKYQYTKVRKFDATVYFNYNVTDTQKEEYINKISEFATTNRINVDIVKVKYDKLEYTNELIYLIDNKKELFNFNATNNATISTKTAQILKLVAGNSIDVYDSYNNILTFRVDNVFENYISQYIYIKDKTKQANAVIVKFKDGYNDITRLYDKEIVYNIISEKDSKEMFEKQIVSLNFVITLMLALGLSLAVVVSYNLGNINILERKRELSTLKVLGYNWFELRMYIFREIVLLTISSIGLGLFLGRRLQLFIADQFKVSPLSFVIDLDYKPFVYTSLLIILVITIVIILLSIKIKKINMLEALKSGE